MTCFLCQTYKKCPASVLEVVSKVDRGGGAAGGGEPAPPSQGRAGKAKRQSKVSVLTEPVQIESDEGEEDDDDDIDGQVYEDGDLKIGCAHNICHVCASSVSVAIFFCEFLRSWCSFRKYAVVDVLRNTIEREMREEKSAVDDESTELELDAAVEDTWRQLGCIGMAVVAAVLEASPIGACVGQLARARLCVTNWQDAIQNACLKHFVLCPPCTRSRFFGGRPTDQTRCNQVSLRTGHLKCRCDVVVVVVAMPCVIVYDL